MRVLVSAYACEPHRGSEPWVGWNWTKQIARFHEVWVLTRANNRTVIETELKRNPVANLHFCYFDLPPWMSFWKKKQRGVYLYYYLWQIGAFLYARKLNSQIEFDVAHHITFGSNHMPSFISLLPTPFIWGPVGSEDMPKSLKSGLSFKNRFLESIRNWGRVWGHYIDPFVKITAKRSRIILDMNSKWTKSTFFTKYESKIIKMSQNGININEYPPKERNKAPGNILRILTVARLVPWKGVSLACKAFAAFSKNFPMAEMTIIGGGPEREKLISIFERENLLNRVQFLGQLSMNEFLNYLPKCDIFLYPSFHHGQATVILQVMAAGLPIVSLDCDTTAETVTKECGIQVRPKSPEQVVEDLAKALELLATKPQMRDQMGKEARKRVEKVYDWNKRGEEMKKVYDMVVKSLNEYSFDS